MTSSSTTMGEPESYVDAHRYDGAAIHHDRAGRIVPCALQPRDVAILHDVWRYKFLTAHQIIELWWHGCTARAAQRRLRKLFDAGYLERFRPITRRGSFPWTYHLGHEGHRLLQHHGLIPAGQRYARPQDLRLRPRPARAAAQRLGARLPPRPRPRAHQTGTARPTSSRPAAARNGQLRLGDDWSAKGLREPHARLLRPDAVLEIERDDGDGTHTFLIEYDRTRRVDKNYGKFRRYDAFLNWWWHHTPLADLNDPPYVLFVCQDQDQREQFMAAADHELTGHRWHPSVPADRHEYVARGRVLFTVERDVHAGALDAWRLPAFPPEHPGRTPEVRRVRLPGGYIARSADASGERALRAR